MNDWNGKRVLIIGAARQGTALARYLVEKSAQVVLNDQRPLDQLSAARETLANLESSGALIWRCGAHSLEILKGIDLVCPSGGVPLSLPLVAEAMRRGIPLSNDSQIFLEACPCQTVGITGSAGKSTTTALVGMIAQASGKDESRKVWVGGNIGLPLISLVDEMTPGDLVVMELSSFQLEIMTRSVNVAAVLNITPNHLDRHETMEAYTSAKSHLVQYQQAADVTVLGRDDPGAWSLATQAPGKVVSFGLHRPPEGQAGVFLDGKWLSLWDGNSAIPAMPRDCIHLRGIHNLHNVLAACAIAWALEIPVQAMQTAVENFYGIPHRLELVRRIHGVEWYNDSIATAPERAMAAIRSFDEPIVLLAGGRDKNLPWDEFARMVRQRVDHLVLFGESSDKISRAMNAAQPGERPFTLTRCADLKEAIQAAALVAEAGDVVLLSPGGTSFDEFRDFEERGEAYRQWVLELS
jgi:UDP-N-acetylmuramoylalanine--D-glutamate ligase